MNHQPVSEESPGPLEGPIDKLIGDDQLTGMNLLLQAAGGGNRYEMSHTELLHAENVCAVVDLRRQQSMAAAVTGEKDHFELADWALVERIGRAAERGLQLHHLDFVEPVHLVEAAASDHSKYVLCHIFQIAAGLCC